MTGATMSENFTHTKSPIFMYLISLTKIRGMMFAIRQEPDVQVIFWRSFMRKFLLSTAAIMGIALSSHAYAAACSSSDLSLTIGNTTYTPGSCVNGIDATHGPTTEVTSMNTGLNQSGVLLADSDGDTSSFNGISFSLAVDPLNTNQSQGSWTLTWTDTSGLPNLPAIFDLEVGVYGGSNGAAYLLDGVTLPVTPDDGTGSFDITFLNHGGQVPDFSHMIVAGTYIGTPQQVNDVPEPMSLAIVGAGLTMLGLAKRKRRAA